jgi:hypothetical protein
VAIIQIEITQIVTEKIGFALFGFINTGDIIKTKSPFEQLSPAGFSLSVGALRKQNASVFSQDIVGVAHNARLLTRHAIVPCTAALVVAKALIYTPCKLVATGGTCAIFLNFYHSDWVLILNAKRKIFFDLVSLTKEIYHQNKKEFF